MFQKPRRNFLKYFHKPRITIDSNTKLTFGEFGFLSLQNDLISKKQIEAIRIIITRNIRKRRVLKGHKTKQRGWLKLKAYYFVTKTKKGSKSRMGKGKGTIDTYCFPVKHNDCFLELKNVSFLLAHKLLRKVSFKLGFKIALIDKQGNIYKIGK